MKILMLGDSITAMMPTELIDAQVDNKSLYGGIIKYIAKILDNLDLMVYDKIVVLAGINDFLLPTVYHELETKNDEEIVNELFALVQVLKENSTADIFVQSIYPIYTNHFDHDFAAKHIKNMNELIKSSCDKYKTQYLDVYKMLVDGDGNLNLKYAQEDGLHPNKQGYEKICERINNEVVKKTKNINKML